MCYGYEDGRKITEVSPLKELDENKLLFLRSIIILPGILLITLDEELAGNHIYQEVNEK